jgi:GNAT superfamily N-acetyltransferase
MLLYAVDVVEHARREGHGRALVQAFIEHARSLGCTEVWVLTDDGNRAALATYAATGGTREPDDSVMFVWRLAPGHHSG